MFTCLRQTQIFLIFLHRTCIDTYVRQPLYILLQIGIVRCPLDQRYNTLLFVWYTYIRPWRFSPQTISNDHKATTLLDTTAMDQDTIPQDQSIINAETINFVEHNLPFYGRLFQFATDRLQKTDLTNSLIAQLINKLANVLNLLNNLIQKSFFSGIFSEKFLFVTSQR
jgi:hypothetical protein